MKTYTLHVSIPGTGRVWRKLELRADQTLENLHFAIQDAFRFDADHLYSYFMSGRAWDSSTEYKLPEGADPWGMVWGDEDEGEDVEEEGLEEEDVPLTEDEFVEFLRESLRPEELVGERRQAFEERAPELYQRYLSTFVGPGNVLTTTLEDLHLEVGQTFLYLFDYGDEWRLKVRVHAINPEAPEGDYPRVVEAVGEPPPQYATDWE